MTIDDKVRDGKLQYDINREVAKISALSFGKVDKYEYLTGEEILASNQRQIIEQVKFAYSPLGKAFEKTTKTIKAQGEKQIKAIEDNKKQQDNKQLDNKQQGNNESLLSKEREILKNSYNKRLDKIDELSKKIDYGDLQFVVNSTGLETDFIQLKDPVAAGEEPATKPTTKSEVATKLAKTKTKRKMSSLKLREEFLNKINNEEYI